MLGPAELRGTADGATSSPVKITRTPPCPKGITAFRGLSGIQVKMFGAGGINLARVPVIERKILTHEVEQLIERFLPFRALRRLFGFLIIKATTWSPLTVIFDNEPAL
jgi:hypothetical protein